MCSSLITFMTILQMNYLWCAIFFYLPFFLRYTVHQYFNADIYYLQLTWMKYKSTFSCLFYSLSSAASHCSIQLLILFPIPMIPWDFNLNIGLRCGTKLLSSNVSYPLRPSPLTTYFRYLYYTILPTTSVVIEQRWDTRVSSPIYPMLK